MRIRIAETNEIKRLSYISDGKDRFTELASDDIMYSSIDCEYVMFKEDFNKWKIYLDQKKEDILKLKRLCKAFKLNFQTEYEFIVGFRPDRESEHECFHIEFNNMIEQYLIQRHQLIDIAKCMKGMKLTSMAEYEIATLFRSRVGVILHSKDHPKFICSNGVHFVHEDIEEHTDKITFIIQDGIIVDAWV